MQELSPRERETEIPPRVYTVTGVLTSTLKCLPFPRRVPTANTGKSEFFVPAGPVRFFTSSSPLQGRPLPAVPSPFLERPSPGSPRKDGRVCRGLDRGAEPGPGRGRLSSAKGGAEAKQAPALLLRPAAGLPAPGPLPGRLRSPGSLGTRGWGGESEQPPEAGRRPGWAPLRRSAGRGPGKGRARGRISAARRRWPRSRIWSARRRRGRRGRLGGASRGLGHSSQPAAAARLQLPGPSPAGSPLPAAHLGRAHLPPGAWAPG